MENNSLSHFGVKGMKWGRRKTPEKKFYVSKESSTKFDKRPATALSNKQLKSRIARLDLEKRYSDLSAPKKSAGKEFVKNKLLIAGGAALAGVLVTSTTRIAKAALDPHVNTVGKASAEALQKKFPLDKTAAMVGKFLK